ncbi:hypothetical protein [Mangrovibacterium sp.]|uniref:hypothetical protein n=1 Tax=Mangrovibacterium sp. TaxID=1961364 RepID=UPI0035681813
MEFKKLELQPKGNWFQRNIWTQHGRKTLLYVGIGAILSFSISYFSGDINLENLTMLNALKSMWFGAFMGFLLTNSPCARGKC